MRTIRCTLALVLLAVAVAALVRPLPLAGQGVTTAAVTGQVTDEQGQPLAGIQIVVTNSATGTVRGVLTRQDGRYLIPGFPPGGPYRIEARGLGYGTEDFTGVSLALSQTQQFDFQLGSQAVELEEVRVTAERGNVISKDRMGTSTVVGDSAISRLPTITRDFTDFVRLSPQISTGGAGASAAGRNNRYNTIQIDGSVNNDIFGLAASGTPGGQAGTKPISLEAIQEFQVVLSPTDVRQGGFTGAGINAVTKSGTNDFHGSLFFFNKNEALVGEYQTLSGDPSGEYPDFYQNEYGLSLGGPIVEDKLHFFVNGELNRRSAPIGLVAGSGDAQIEFEEAQAVADILATQYSYEPGAVGALNLKRESDLLFGRLDWNINPQHRLTLRHNYVDAFDDNLSRSNSTYRLGGNLYAFNSVTNSTVAQLNSTLSNGIFNELRIGYQIIRDQREPQDLRPSVRVILPGSGFRSIFAGSEQFSGRNALDQDLLEITNDLNLRPRAPQSDAGHAQRILPVQQPLRSQRVRLLRVRESGQPRCRNRESVRVQLPAPRRRSPCGVSRPAVRGVRAGPGECHRQPDGHRRTPSGLHLSSRGARGQPHGGAVLQPQYQRGADQHALQPALRLQLGT